jgi:small-conductance mechanosensitive channel
VLGRHPLKGSIRRTAGRLACLLALVFLPRAHALNEGLGEAPKDLDRSSPFATVQGFLSEARHGHFLEAAQDLWLDHLPVAQQPAEGARLARRLRFVLDRQPFDLAALPKEGEGGPSSVTLTTLDVDGRPIPVRLVRVRTGDAPAWVFSRDTVRAVDALYEEYGPPLGEKMPAFLFMTRFGLELWQWLGLFLGFVLALLVGWLAEKLLLALVGRLTRLTSLTWDDELVRAARGPLKLPLGVFTFQAVVAPLLLPPDWKHAVGLICRSVVIAAATWFALRALDVTTAAMQRTLVARGTAGAAGTRTQLTVLWRVLTLVVYVLGLAALLMQFDVVRTVGVSLLASAGVAGVVVGLAAQKSIGALFAGIQLSLSQPIRIGDKVVVEGESGTVVEISLSNVVLRLWDNRHLIVPVTYFLEKPFQNWSRGGQDTVGVVLFDLDYRIDVGQLRTEFERILSGPGKPLWNGRLAKVQVTDTAEGTATVRLLASAATSDDAFDLRCLVREALLVFLRAHPDWLPTKRVEHRPRDGAPAA